jgi:DNA-binding protein
VQELSDKTKHYSESTEHMELHEKIRLARELNKWSQEEVTEKLEMSPSGYAKIERGKLR